MKLEIAILSSNDNPRYLDFWPYVAKAWKQLIGVEPVLLFIGDSSRVHELSNHGQVIQLDTITHLDMVNQSQSVRLWAGTKFPDKNLIMSDIDMLPISREYFLSSVEQYPDDSLISYTSDVMQYGFYLRSPQLPMCYLAGKGETFNEILGIDNKTSWEEFSRELSKFGGRFGIDQRYFYSKFLRWAGKNTRYRGLSRGWIEGKRAEKRLDKAMWPEGEYDPNNFYDSHMPLPLSENMDKLDPLFKKLSL